MAKNGQEFETHAFFTVVITIIQWESIRAACFRVLMSKNEWEFERDVFLYSPNEQKQARK